MSSAGIKLLSALVDAQDTKALATMRLEPSLFKGEELDLYTFLMDHAHKYGKIPSREMVEENAALEDLLVPTTEPLDYYLDEVEKRFIHNALKGVVAEASSLLVGKQAEAAMDILMRSVATLYQKKNRRHLFDFRNAQEIVWEEYKTQQTIGNLISAPYGWPYLDDMSGGIRPGDFTTFVGRPMAGKTFMMLYTAHNAWKQGHKVLVISLEMLATLLIQRLASMQTHKKLTDLLRAELSTQAFNSMMSDLAKLKQVETPMWVVDGSTVHNLDDVSMLCHQLQPSLLLIDAAYLLGHPDQKLNKWDRQSDNARQAKQRIATDMGIPTLASYQLSKESSKAKKKNKTYEAGGEDVYGSDEIFQLSTVMLGLFDNENDIESKNKRKVRVLKGRNGETGEFHINWDFSSKMDFSQYVVEDPETMQMDHLG